MDKKLESEYIKLENEFRVLRKPLYDKRTDYLKSFPDFWVNAFLGHPYLGKRVLAKDREAFKHLTSIEVEEDTEDKYSITFYFSPNSYFEDTKLTKTFEIHDDTLEATAAKINWKRGKEIPVGLDCGTKRRPRIKESFFNWFIVTHENGGPLLDEIARGIKDSLWFDPLSSFIECVEWGPCKPLEDGEGWVSDYDSNDDDDDDDVDQVDDDEEE